MTIRPQRAGYSLISDSPRSAPARPHGPAQAHGAGIPAENASPGRAHQAVVRDASHMEPGLVSGGTFCGWAYSRRLPLHEIRTGIEHRFTVALRMQNRAPGRPPAADRVSDDIGRPTDEGIGKLGVEAGDRSVLAGFLDIGPRHQVE